MPEPSGPRRPRLALLMGDVAGVGPEVVARVLETHHQTTNLLVVGHPTVLTRALDLVGLDLAVRTVDSPELDNGDPDLSSISCWNPTTVDVGDIPAATVDPRCGRAVADWIESTAAAALEGHVDALVTAPLNKAALAAAGVDVPGHTELLARACHSDSVAMMLYLPPAISPPHGLGVAHVTLHTSIASVPGLLSTGSILERIDLIYGFLRQVGCPAPRIGICALNPHAGEDGLFGDEEQTLIAPAIEKAIAGGPNSSVARYQMSRCSLLAGMLLSPINTGAAHALGYGIEKVSLAKGKQVPHGAAVAMVLPGVMRHNAPQVASKYYYAAGVAGLDLSGKSVEEGTQLAANHVDSLRRRYTAFGSLTSAGLDEKDVPEMVEIGMSVRRLLHPNPVEVTPQHAAAIYREVLT